MQHKYLIPIAPVTKKNSQVIAYNGKTGRMFIAPSKQYRKYEKSAACFISKRPCIDNPVEVTCLFYMPTKRRVDLTNLLEAVDDVLVKYNVLADDHAGIIVSHDGSRVLYGKENPRTEIYITEVNDYAAESRR